MLYVVVVASPRILRRWVANSSGVITPVAQRVPSRLSRVAAFGGTTPYVVTWLTAETGNNVAPAYYVVAAAVVSLLTTLTIRETAGRPLLHGVADEMFQSNADVRGAATTG
jgi:hypothetical protein